MSEHHWSCRFPCDCGRPCCADTATEQVALGEYAPRPLGQPVGTCSCVYCLACNERGTTTRMVVDTDFGGHLCPACDREDVALLGKPDEREKRHLGGDDRG